MSPDKRLLAIVHLKLSVPLLRGATGDIDGASLFLHPIIDALRSSVESVLMIHSQALSLASPLATESSSIYQTSLRPVPMPIMILLTYEKP